MQIGKIVDALNTAILKKVLAKVVMKAVRGKLGCPISTPIISRLDCRDTGRGQVTVTCTVSVTANEQELLEYIERKIDEM